MSAYFTASLLLHWPDSLPEAAESTNLNYFLSILNIFFHRKPASMDQNVFHEL